MASRRLRELLPVLQLDGHAAEKLERRLRRVTRRLGEVRELDVLLGAVRDLQKDNPDASHALGRMTGDIQRERDEARKQSVGKPLVVELHRIARKLDAAVGTLKENEAERTKAWRWAAEARVARRAGALRDAIDEAAALYIPERLHVVRIALKKFRYALEILSDASGQDRADLATLKRGQDLLGRLHDLQVLIEHARRMQAGADKPEVAMWREFDILLTTLEKECRRLHARYVRQRLTLRALCEKHAGKPGRMKHGESRKAG